MKPIWYFVGLLLLVMGILVFVAGIFFLVSPSSHKTVLGETHPSIWWGAIMIIAGAIFLIKNWKVKVE